MAAAVRHPVDIVIDGMNVSRSREQDLPWLSADDAAAVDEVVRYFCRLGADSVKVFGARAWCESTPELRALQTRGCLFCAPGGHDDEFMLSYADRKGAFIVSNDRFADHVAARGYDSLSIASCLATSSKTLS